jgi:hypothetical protein
MIPSPLYATTSLGEFIKHTYGEMPSVEFLTEQVESNVIRLAELEARVPNFLKEKAFAFVDLRSNVITLQDIEDYEYDTADVNYFCRKANELLSIVELRATELGY